ncbi:hypothetical protein CLOM_g4452 [Closterium sp. NIES-68]|nr:hypothetical protein CLOM_g4452 [Closterium sp. NIES-68]GJP77437.1 hypothetical protein CLOP_g7831 [Closterium sp. NIES-67]
MRAARLPVLLALSFLLLLVASLLVTPLRAEDCDAILDQVEACEENVDKMKKARFEAENKFDATSAFGEKMKEKGAECAEKTAKNAAERKKEKSELMAQVLELEGKVKDLQEKLGISEDTTSGDNINDSDTTSDK